MTEKEMEIIDKNQEEASVKVTKNKSFKIYLTEEQADLLKKKAENSNKSISQYLYDCSENRVDVTVTINDLTEFTAQIYEIEKKINSIKNIAIQAQDINEKEIARIENLMININNICKDILEKGYEDRKVIERNLKKYCKEKLS